MTDSVTSSTKLTSPTFRECHSTCPCKPPNCVHRNDEEKRLIKKQTMSPAAPCHTSHSMCERMWLPRNFKADNFSSFKNLRKDLSMVGSMIHSEMRSWETVHRLGSDLQQGNTDMMFSRLYALLWYVLRNLLDFLDVLRFKDVLTLYDARHNPLLLHRYLRVMAQGDPHCALRDSLAPVVFSAPLSGLPL